MEIKEEATSSKLYFKQTNLSKEIQHNIKGKIKEFTKCLKSEEKLGKLLWWIFWELFPCQPSESDGSFPLVLFAQEQALETTIHHSGISVLVPNGHCQRYALFLIQFHARYNHVGDYDFPFQVHKCFLIPSTWKPPQHRTLGASPGDAREISRM